MGTKKQALEYFNNDWQMKIKHLLGLNHEINELESNRRALIDNLKKLLSFFEELDEKPPTAIPPELLTKQRTSSIGDELERLLRQNGGSMLRTEVMEVLKMAGVLTGKNARIILKNAIKRDARKRFKAIEGRLALTLGDVTLKAEGKVGNARKEKADAIR